MTRAAATAALAAARKNKLAVIRALGRIGDARAIAPLTKLLADRQLARMGVYALGQSRSRAALAPLLAVVRDRRRPSKLRVTAYQAADRIAGAAQRLALARELLRDKRRCCAPGGAAVAPRRAATTTSTSGSCGGTSASCAWPIACSSGRASAIAVY